MRLKPAIIPTPRHAATFHAVASLTSRSDTWARRPSHAHTTSAPTLATTAYVSAGPAVSSLPPSRSTRAASNAA